MKILKLTYWMAGALLLAGCAEDQGNYDYKDPLVIEIEGFATEYTANALMDTIRVSPVITPAGREYEYFWGVYEENVMGYAPKLDTVGFEKDVEYLVAKAPGSYQFVYCARDKETGVATLIRRDLTVGTQLSKGWYVLKSENGMSDIDLHTLEETGSVYDVISKNNDGYQLAGEGVDMAFFSRYRGTWDAARQRWVNTTVFVICSEADACVLKVASGEVIRYWEDLFFEPPTVRKPQGVFEGSTTYLLMNNGKFHGIYYMSTNSGRFGLPFIGDYELSKWRVNTACYNGIYYDLKNDRLIQADLSISSLADPVKEGVPPVRDLGMEPLFSTAVDDYSSFIMLRKKGTDEYQLRKYDLYVDMKDGDNIYLNHWDIDGSYGITQGTHWACFRGHEGIFYARNNEIYYCNVAGNFSDTKQTVAHGSGETVTMLKDVRGATDDRIAIATQDASGNYKVYLYKALAGMLQPNPIVLTGRGKVVKIHEVDGNYSSDNYDL